jgi:hypothetical protein
MLARIVVAIPAVDLAVEAVLVGVGGIAPWRGMRKPQEASCRPCVVPAPQTTLS